MALLAVALSLGFNGPLYRWLYAHVWALDAFRAPARFGILVCCALAVLAAFGFERLQERFPGVRARQVLLVGALVAVAVDGGSAPISLWEVPRAVPGVYRIVKTFEPSVLIELPIADGDMTAFCMYWSSRHWQRLVNGYSGYQPADYTDTLDAMETFPDDESIARLRMLHVRYILVHSAFYKARDYTRLLLRIAQRPDIVAHGAFRDWVGPTQIFELKGAAP